MSMLQRYVPNSFPLPHEVFEMGLGSGSLLVYHKSQRHSTNALSCAAISKLVGLCEKTVRTHLRALEGEGLIQVESSGGKFTCTLCPIRDMVEKRCAADPVRARKVSWWSTKQQWLTGEMFKAVFPLPNEVFQLSLKSGELLVYIYLQYQKSAHSDQCWPSYATISAAVAVVEQAATSSITPAKRGRKAKGGERNQRHRKDAAAICA